MHAYIQGHLRLRSAAYSKIGVEFPEQRTYVFLPRKQTLTFNKLKESLAKDFLWHGLIDYSYYCCHLGEFILVLKELRSQSRNA